jgi:hypothetical protein
MTHADVDSESRAAIFEFMEVWYNRQRLHLNSGLNARRPRGGTAFFDLLMEHLLPEPWPVHGAFQGVESCQTSR